MGMPAEEYWHTNYDDAYRKAYRIRKEEKNWELWLQGLYFYHAISVALQNAFSKGQKREYMSEPLKIFPPTEEEIKAKEERQAMEIERKLNAFAMRFNERQQHRT